MGTGYTRNDTANNIADGNVINASDLDGEFDAIQAAFNASTGHSHDGTTGEGPQIGTGGIADNAVTTAKITDANVTTAKIADSNVTLAKMAANSVDSDQYVDGSIDRVHLSADIIDGTKLADNAVDSEHYTDGSIDRVHLAADIIDGTKIADDVINSEHYVAGSIDAEHLASSSVTAAKVANNAVALGTKTTGNYVGTITGGTGIDSTGATSGEGIAHTLNLDLNELSTSTANTDGDYFVVVDSADGSQHKLTKGNINISGFNNDSGFTTNVGDITGVTAGTNLTGGGTSGTVTLNMATGGVGAGTYGSTDDGTKIDTITVDAYGRVTAVATGATMDRWILEDGDGTEVVINRDNEVKFVEAGGIDINWTDTSNGSDGDPYDLSFSIVSYITAGNGLTGGGQLNASRTLNVGAGTGIDVAADSISVDVSDFMSNGSNNRVITATGADAMNAESNLTFDGSSLNINGNINAVDNIYLADTIYHEGDTDTYIDFVGANEARVVTGNSESIRFRTNYIQAFENVQGSVETASKTGSVTPDMQNYNSFVWTLTGNITLNNPTTELAGSSGVFIFIHSGAARTVSLGTDWETAGGAGLTLSSASGAVDIVPYYVQASGNILLGAPQLAFS